MIAADETGRPQFYDLLRRARAPAYVAFDLLWLDGTDLRSLPLGERRKRLQAILPTKSPIIAKALSVTGRGRELFELMCSNDLEGIVAKRLDDPYEPRVRWLKIKNGDYSQKEGRGDLFNGPRQPLAYLAGKNRAKLVKQGSSTRFEGIVLLEDLASQYFLEQLMHDESVIPEIVACRSPR